MKKTILVFVMIVSIAILAACSPTVPVTGPNSTSVPTTAPAAATAAPSSSETEVSIDNFAFSPDTLSVKAGTTVKWTNHDSTAHTITADDKSFDSGNLDTGKSFSFTFKQAGTFAYHCSIHPNMKAKIVVTG